MRDTKTKPARAALTLFFLLASSVVCAAQGAPVVEKVEPPNWWANHSVNPVRLLIRGRNLSGARVEAESFAPATAAARGDGVGLKTGLLRVNERGTYLFLDVHIEPGARPGRRSIRLRNASGAADFDFEVSEPVQRRGRFQGFTPDDVIYFIMPDRFADGDRNNNNPAKSPGLYDRTKGRYYHGGDFQGLIERLPYLKDLGVTALWINPVYDNTDRLDEREMYPEVEGGPKRPTTPYHGYGAIDFYGIEEHYGDMRKLRELVDKAHSMGLKVIQDQIANHTSPYHPWATDRPTP
ncbi:MAG TPA: alpha-amylase family glycosyl hydrolase, partial [Pyrinomonadaceae bacterium]|nr:alpha-amylase family glycosyl hydrolase [Pyrinomonadaceae bacterium]